MEPWISPELVKLFEGTIVRYRENPELWHEELCPVPRIFLLFGQDGENMENALEELCKRYDVDAMEVLATESTEETRGMLKNAEKHKKELLVIRRGHLLLHHPELYHKTVFLKHAYKQHEFIIVVTDVIPQVGKHPFWGQFEEHNMILMDTPTKDYCKTMLRYLFDGWANHWTQGSNVSLSDEDFEWLALSCGYCVPKDMVEFSRRVFRHVLETNEDITRELLEGRFMHNNIGIEGVLCIVKRDTQHAQSMYAGATGKGSKDALTIDQVEQQLDRRRKRPRLGTDPSQPSSMSIGV